MNARRMTKYQLEVAARTLCELRSLDPDEIVGHGPEPAEDESVYDVLLHSPRWHLAEKEIREFAAMSIALDAGLKVAPTYELQASMDQILGDLK